MTTRPLWPRPRQRLPDGSDMTMPVPRQDMHPVIPSRDTPEGEAEVTQIREAMLYDALPGLYGEVTDYEHSNAGMPQRITREYSQAIDSRMETMSLHERIDLEISRSQALDGDAHSSDYDALSYARSSSRSAYDPLAAELAPDGEDNFGSDMRPDTTWPSAARVTRPRGWYGK